MVESWAKAVGERAKVPSFEEVLRDPKQYAYFTALLRATLKDPSGATTSVDIATSRDDTVPVKRNDLESALAKIQVKAVSDESGKKGVSSLRNGEPLTDDERKALLPLYTAFQRATASIETLNKQFKQDELQAVINWAGNNSSELGALLTRTGNNSTIFVEALRSVAFSNPELFATLAGQMEHARRIAREDTDLISKLKELGNKHGIPMPDLLDAVRTASSSWGARNNILALIQNQMKGAWFAPIRSRLSVMGVNAFGALHRYKAKDSSRNEVLAEGKDSLAKSLMRTIIDDPEDRNLERESGTFKETFERMLAGPKTPTDHEVMKQRLVDAQKAVDANLKDIPNVSKLIVADKYRVGSPPLITYALWADHTNDDSAEEIARTVLDREFADELSSSEAGKTIGIFGTIFRWLFDSKNDSKNARGSLYAEKDVKTLAGKIKTIS